MASNYLKALQLTKQLEKKAQEATQNRKQAETEINAAEELIKSAKKMDANVAKAEAKLTEATSALSTKEFKTALELAIEAKTIAEDLQQDHVVMVIDSTKNLVSLAKDLDAKVPGLDEKLTSADSAVQEGNYEEALEIAKKGWEEVDKLLNEKVSNSFSTAQSMIVLAKKVKEDVSEAETLLDTAREHVEKNDYSKALRYINDCMQITRKIAEEEVSKSLENSMSSIDLAKRMKAETKKAEELYSEAKKAMDGKDYEKAISTAKKSVADIEKILERQSKNILRDCEDGFRHAKDINAEVTKASLLLNKAREAFKSKNYVEMYDYSIQIDEEVENAQFQCVLKTISLSRPKFITAKNIGADLSDSMKYLDMARASLKDKKFTEALENARKGEFIVNNLIGDYEGAKEELQLITQSLSRASKIGVDTTAISDNIMEAKSAFDSKDFKNAMNLIAQCREKIEKAMHERTMEVVNMAEGIVLIGEKTGSDVAKAKEMIDQANEAVAANDFGKAIEMAQKSKSAAGDGLKKGISEEVSRFVGVVKSFKDGDEKAKCVGALKGAKEALGKADFENAYSCILDCSNTIEDYVKTSTEILDATVAELKEMGGEIPEFEDKKSEMDKLFARKKYTEVLSLSDELIKDINTQQQKTVTDMVSTINEDINHAKKLGMNITEQEKRLQEAKQALIKRFFKKAYTELAQSREDMRVILGKHQEFSDVITQMKSRLIEAERKGIDISSPQKKLENALKGLKEKDFTLVSKNIKDSESELTQLFTVHDIKEKMGTAKECIDIAKGLEMETADAEQQLKKTVIFLNNGQYENALESVNKTVENSEQLCNLKLSEMLSNAYSMIIEAKKIGLDVLTVEVLYQKAEEALSVKRYEKAARYASGSLNEIEEIRDESQRAANIIHLAQNYIQEAENLKADVKDAKDLLNKAFAELKDNEYMSSIEMGKKCIRKAKAAKHNKVAETITSFQSIIDKSKADGMDVTKAEKTLGEANLALEDEDYPEALRLAMLSESEVEKVDLQKKMAAEIISVTAAKLKEAEKHGIDVDNVRSRLMNAANALKEKKYVNALELAMESGMDLSESTEKFERASTTLYAASARINESDDIGVDVKKSKEHLATAKEAFEKKDYATAMKFAKETILEAKRAYVEHLSRPIEACEQLIDTATKLGVDITRATNMLSEAKAALDEESYSQVALFAENCKRLVEREITKHLFDSVAGAKATVANAEGDGKQVGDASQMLRKVESSLEERKYIQAADFFQEFKDSLIVSDSVMVGAGMSVAQETEVKETTEEKLTTDISTFISDLDKRLHKISKAGLNTKKAEKLLKEAQGIFQSDPDRAAKLAREGENELESELESFSPKITYSIDLSKIKDMDKIYETKLELTNDGKSVAKDVNIAFSGNDFEVTGLAPITIVKAKETKEIPITVKPLSEGNLKFALDITFIRLFDGKENTVQFSEELVLGEEKTTTEKFKRIKAEKTVKCFACNGKIKTGFPLIQCLCGNTYHEPCGERIGKCPMCGVSFKTSDSDEEEPKKKGGTAKKKVALKL